MGDAAKKQKPLSEKQAWNCENAREPKCVCRCGGRLHGAKRGGSKQDGSIDRAFFESLPADDPHYLPDDAAKAAAKAARLEAKRREREEFQRRRSEYLQRHAEETAKFYRDHPEYC